MPSQEHGSGERWQQEQEKQESQPQVPAYYVAAPEELGENPRRTPELPGEDSQLVGK